MTIPLRLRPHRRFAALVVFGTSTYVFFVRIGRTSALWLLRLMAASIWFYGVKSWLRHMTLEMHSDCIRLRGFSLHWIRENARSWFSDWSKPTDGATKSGPTPMTHCGVMVGGNCEGCHRRRLMSWVTCHRKQVENVTFEAVTSGKSKFQTVEKYLNSLTRTACSTV